jgi:hypothetical protein
MQNPAQGQAGVELIDPCAGALEVESSAMSGPVFTTREEALIEAERVFFPSSLSWDIAPADVSWTPELQLLRRHGALPTPMHFGATELDLAKGEVRFVDQDHRDGGDFVVHCAPLPQAWLDRLRTLVK